jgi:hypothetical protein
MKSYLPSLVVAAVVLVLVFSGGAVASKLITGAQVKNESLTGADVRNRSLGVADLATKARSGYQIVVKDSAVLTEDFQSFSVTATCPAGKVVVGGGAHWLDNVEPVQNFATANGRGWTAQGHNPFAAPDRVRIQIICANP